LISINEVIASTAIQNIGVGFAIIPSAIACYVIVAVSTVDEVFPFITVKCVIATFTVNNIITEASGRVVASSVTCSPWSPRLLVSSVQDLVLF